MMTSMAAPAPLKAMARKLLKGSSLGERLVSLSTAKTSYSQFGEDMHLSSYYSRLIDAHKITIKNGYFVDIGAFRPMVNSNSYFFYKQGWRGINIDPTPGFKRNFDKLRPRDVNLEVGIASKAETATLYLFGVPNVWNTFDPQSAAQASKASGMIPKHVPVALERLDAILDQHMKVGSLELLLIDAEGYDMQILRSNDFSKYRPRVILIEAMDSSVEILATNPIILYLDDLGYKLHSWINPNLMLVREDSLVF